MALSSTLAVAAVPQKASTELGLPVPSRCHHCCCHHLLDNVCFLSIQCTPSPVSLGRMCCMSAPCRPLVTLATRYSLVARGQSIPQDKDLLRKLKELFHISMGFLQNSVDSDLLPKLKEAACFACENLKTFMPNANAQWHACCRSEFIPFASCVIMHQSPCPVAMNSGG